MTKARIMQIMSAPTRKPVELYLNKTEATQVEPSQEES